MKTEMIKDYIEGNIGWIVLNNTRRKNALHKDMYKGILTVLEEYEKDENIRTIVLKGNGGNFSSGYDLSQGLPVPSQEGQGNDFFGHRGFGQGGGRNRVGE